MCMDACEEWVQGYFHLMTTGKFGFVGFESLCHDSMSDHFYCGWFAIWDYDSSITAWSSLSSLVLFQAVQWLHWCGALPNAMRPMDIGWRKVLRLSAREPSSLIGSFLHRCEEFHVAHLPAACWAISFFSGSSEVTPDSQIRNLKLYEINGNQKRKSHIRYMI